MMQKLLLTLIASLLSVFVADGNLIDWSDSRKLEWSDFKAKPDPSSPNAALTSSTINVEFGYDQNGLKHSITCRFDKLKSWVRVKNDYILNHEQGHFNLAEAYARQLHKQLQQYKFNQQSAGADLNKIYADVMQQHINSQDQYDKQTDHSLDTAKQHAWDLKISGLLKELEEYKSYTSEKPIQR